MVSDALSSCVQTNRNPVTAGYTTNTNTAWTCEDKSCQSEVTLSSMCSCTGGFYPPMILYIKMTLAVYNENKLKLIQIRSGKKHSEYYCQYLTLKTNTPVFWSDQAAQPPYRPI